MRRDAVWEERFRFRLDARALHATDLKVLLQYNHDAKNDAEDDANEDANDAASAKIPSGGGDAEEGDAEEAEEEKVDQEEYEEEDSEEDAEDDDATVTDRAVIPLSALEVGEPLDDWYLVSNSDAMVRLCLLLRPAPSLGSSGRTGRASGPGRTPTR